MMADTLTWACDDAERISRALTVDGAHLFIGQGGYTLFYQHGTTLSGYDVAPMKAACIAAGLPVIDSRMLPFDTALRLAIHSPMIAVGEPPDAQPWHGWAHASLHHVAALPELRTVLAGLVEWAARTGGWEAPCWQEADAVLSRLQDPRAEA